MLHEKRHHAMMRKCSGYLLWGKAKIPLFTNNLGLRDVAVRDVPFETDGRSRLLFLGDSFTLGFNPWEESFVGLIGAKLSNVEVLNGGQESYSPSNYYLLAKDLLDNGVQIDEVFVAIDISDVQDEAGSYVDVDDGRVDLSNTFSYSESAYIRFRRAIRERWLLTDTMYTFAERVLVRVGVLWLPYKYNLFDSPTAAWTYRTGLDADYPSDGYAPLGVEGGIRKAIIKMDDLSRLLNARGISISVVVYPWPAQLKQGDLESRQVSIWRGWCREKCRRFINLFPDFFAEMDKCPSFLRGCWYEGLFVFGDVHFSAYGNALVARRVVEELIGTPIVRSGSPIPPDVGRSDS